MQQPIFLFPGQGAQSIGMGRDFYEASASVRRLFEKASEITQLDLKRLCFEGPMEDLTQTVHLQPAMTLINLACLTVLKGAGIHPSITAGHSLGEYAALAGAGVVSEEDALRLVFKRGELMHREALKHPGAMHAIVGLTIKEVQPLVAAAAEEGAVAVANHNMEKQIVITGTPELVKKVSKMATSQGAKSIPLKVSGAWHSLLMKGAEADFIDFLSKISFHPPTARIAMNVTGTFEDDPLQIRELMARQLCSPVKWFDAMQAIIAEKPSLFVEVGPGKVLTGLLKKILPKQHPYRIFNVNNVKTLETVATEMDQ